MRLPGTALGGGLGEGRPEPEPRPDAAGEETADLDGRQALALAADLARAGRYDQAEQVLLQARGEPVLRPVALDLQARIYAQQGRYCEAEACWLEAVRLSPGNPRYRQGLDAIANERRASGWDRVFVPAIAAAATTVMLLAAFYFGMEVGRRRPLVAPQPAVATDKGVSKGIEALAKRLDALEAAVTAGLAPRAAPRARPEGAPEAAAPGPFAASSQPGTASAPAD